MTPEQLQVLVVDDDAQARARLRALLGEHPDVVVVGECADGREAVEALSTLAVDLVFLDVQMPGLDGFGVLAEIGPARMPPVVFTSAYSEFAVRAFDAYAIDYLLKPFDDARLAVALGRAREQVRRRRSAATRKGGAPAPESVASSAPESPAAESGAEPDGLDARLAGLLEHVRRSGGTRYPEAIAIKSGGQYVVVRVADVDWIEADGNYARVWVQRRHRLLAKSLAALERDVLDPDVFIRVHRSAIVNATKIASVEPQFHGEVVLVLHDGTRVDCSRRYRKRLEEKLYFTT